MTANLRAAIEKEASALTIMRRSLHKIPELSYEERKTSRFVLDELARLGVEHKGGLAGGTGVLGHIPGTRAGAPTIALRADMDALPIDERTGAEYASTHAGMMHACGHDGHTTILLGAARVLSGMKERANNVTLLFQPAEEGGAGGKRMCDEGALRGSAGGGIGAPVTRIYGLHGWPTLPLGHVATRPGALLAATDDFVVRVRGKGGHAAQPHLVRDPVLASAHVVTALQSIASRATSPNEACVVTVSTIHAGTANNIIPDEVELSGTVRTLSGTVRDTARRRFFEVVESAARAMACEAEIDWQDGYPSTVNDAREAERVLAVARETLGESRVHLEPHATMGGEDFSYYGAHVPACFFFLGLARDGRAHPLLHQPDFDFNDDAIAPGVLMMCRLALS